jgi:hypothetical protein
MCLGKMLYGTTMPWQLACVQDALAAAAALLLRLSDGKTSKDPFLFKVNATDALAKTRISHVPMQDSSFSSTLKIWFVVFGGDDDRMDHSFTGNTRTTAPRGSVVRNIFIN